MIEGVKMKYIDLLVCLAIFCFWQSLYVYGGYEINAGILSDFYKLNLTRNTYVWESVI